MKQHPFFRILWNGSNFLLLISLTGLLFGIMWEYSTRRYLHGFADAVVPLSAPPEQKVEAILAWMKHGPARRAATDPELLAFRDPHDTLNYKQLLQVCGTATNAFVNLASSSGLESRRLLLLGPDRQSRHVVAEVRIEGRWIVVDPSFHVVFRDPSGKLLTRQQLQDPAVWQQATRVVANYPEGYNYERTVHVRLARIPWVGRWLRKTLDSVYPGWEEAVNWTLVVERESFGWTILMTLLAGFWLLLRFVLSWYGEKRLGITRVRLRQHLLRAGVALFSSPR